MRIRANLNVVGRPEEFVDSILDDLAKKISSEMEVTKTKKLEPKKLGKHFFSGFLEVELKVKGFQGLVNFLLDYTPVTIEIMETKDVTIPLGEFQSGVSDIVTRFQEYEEGIKGLRAANTLIKRQMESFSKQKSGKTDK